MKVFRFFLFLKRAMPWNARTIRLCAGRYGTASTWGNFLKPRRYGLIPEVRLCTKSQSPKKYFTSSTSSKFKNFPNKKQVNFFPARTSIGLSGAYEAEVAYEGYFACPVGNSFCPHLVDVTDLGRSDTGSKLAMGQWPGACVGNRTAICVTEIAVWF